MSRRARFHLTTAGVVTVVLAAVVTACGSAEAPQPRAEAICTAIADAPDAATAALVLQEARDLAQGTALDLEDFEAALDEHCGRHIAAIAEAAATADPTTEPAADPPHEPDPDPDPDPDPAADPAADPTPEPEPSPAAEPEPGPTPTPVDLRTVDFLRQSWSTDCNTLPEFERVLLDADRFEGPVHVFEYFGDPPRPSRLFGVNLDEPLFGDVTGDGQDNALFFTWCFRGNHFEYHVMAWGHDERGAPRQLPSMERADKLTRLFGDLEIHDGAAILQTFEAAPGDSAPHLNGFPIELVTAYRYHESTGWTQSVRSRADVEVAPPDDVPGTGPTQVECAYLGGTIVDESVCDTVNEIIDGAEDCLRDLEQDPLFERIDPDMDLFENLETGAIHGCDI